MKTKTYTKKELFDLMRQAFINMIPGEQNKTKPCPFCGYLFMPNDVYSGELIINKDSEYFTAMCPSCFAQAGPSDSMIGSINNWNERKYK